MILLLGIDAPDIIFILKTVHDILDGFKSGHHGMIDVVVAVLSVAAYTLEVVDRL